jgi:hypothetical protein
MAGEPRRFRALPAILLLRPRATLVEHGSHAFRVVGQSTTQSSTLRGRLATPCDERRRDTGRVAACPHRHERGGRIAPAAGAGPGRPGQLAEPMLEMRPACERCDSLLPQDARAFICSYECTFCADCTTALDHVCPNCGGELVARPRRLSSPSQAN